MSGVRLFAIMTLWVTLALFGFVLWISDGTTLGRVLAAGVLFIGLVQWLVLRRIHHQMTAKTEAKLD